MLNDWISFVVVIFVQSIFFMLQALFMKKMRDVPYLLGLGAMIFTDFKHDSTKAYMLLTNEIVTKILEIEAMNQ